MTSSCTPDDYDSRSQWSSLSRAVGNKKMPFSRRSCWRVSPPDARSRSSCSREACRYVQHDRQAPEAAAARPAPPTDAAGDIGSCPNLFSENLRNTWHAFNGEWYFVDQVGRPSQAVSLLPPIRGEARSSSCQLVVGRWGDATGTGDYDGGHLLGSQLGGYGQRVNMVPQIANFNRGNWVQLENKAAKCNALAEHRLLYWVAATYADDASLIPAAMSLYLEDTQTGAFIELTFDNARGGGTAGTTKRAQGIAFLEQLGCE